MKATGGRYVTVAATGRVDDTLFGPTASEKYRLRVTSGSTTPREGDVLHTAGKKTLQKSGPAPLVLTSSDLQTLKNHATLLTAESERELRETQEREKTLRMAVAAERKDKIRALEAQRHHNVPKSTLEIEEEQERERIRVLAAKARDEATDDAKVMRSMMQYAVAVQVRDRQLVEKQERLDRDRKQERMLEIETELARLENIKRVADHEEASRRAAKAAHEEVQRQMAEAEAARERRRQELRREGAELLAEIARGQAEDRRRTEELRRVKAQQRQETLDANAEAMRQKRLAQEAELAEIARVAREQAEREAKRIAEEEAREEAKRLREESEYKLRGQVQRLQDNRAAVDELRARRAFDAGQRAERQRELERQAKRQAVEDELRKARRDQLALKQARLAEEVEVDKTEYERNRATQQEWIEREREAAAAKRAAALQHMAELLRQKEEQEELARQEVLLTRAEGEANKQAQAARLEHLRQVREKKIQELIELGVDSKYTVQLNNYDPIQPINNDFKLNIAERGAAKGASPRHK